MSAPAFSDFVVSTVSEGALGLLLAPGGWTSGAQARTVQGAAVKPEEDAATSWCVCFTADEVARIESAQVNQAKAASILRALLTEKGSLR